MRRQHYIVSILILFVYIGWQIYQQQDHPEHHRREHRSSEYNSESSKRSSEAVAPAPGADSGDLSKFGLPTTDGQISNLLILHNKGYISGYDTTIQDPRWVETRFFGVTNPSSNARPAEFSPDERVPYAARVTTSYWKGTGFDRGHMAPNWGVSICYGTAAQNETFLLTNVIPQSPNLNRGLWESLEKIISNDYAKRFGQVWVICGPVFPASPAKLNNGLIDVPTSCYKIILRVDDQGNPKVLAFDMPQQIDLSHQQALLPQYLTSVAHIEQETHVRFFPELPDSVRQQLEQTQATRLW